MSVMALAVTVGAPAAQAADRQAPTVTITRPKATTYALNQAVNASYSCQDNRRVATCDGTVVNASTLVNVGKVLSGKPIPTATAGSFTFTVKATDTSNNSTTKSVTYKVGDATPPTITISAPVNNAIYTVNQVVTAGYTCSDTGGSGIGPCTASLDNSTPLDNAQALDTTKPATHTVTFNASDKAGNTTTKSVTYTVQAAPAPGDCTGYYGLTFDDGPNPTYTPQVLAELKAAGAHATFFLIGENVAAAPTLVQQEVADNHTIGNHTYTHPDLTTLSASQVNTQLTRTQQAIQAAAGVTPTFVRPPYGEFNSSTLSVFTSPSLGLANTIWTNDTNDWDGKSVDEIIAAAVAVKNGGIILMHDAYPNTVTALPRIISQLKAKGMCPGKLQSIFPATVEATPAWDGVFYSVVAVKPD